MKDVVIYADNQNHNTGDGLLYEFKLSFFNMVNNYIDKMHLFFSLVLTVFLTAIGWHNHYEIVSFLVNLAILDIITKHISITIQAYKRFTIFNYFKAWKEKYLTSRKFRIGFFVKLFTYSVAFFIANKAQGLEQIFNGQLIANLIYSGIFVAEISSLGENFRDMGVKLFKNIFTSIKKQFIDN